MAVAGVQVALHWCPSPVLSLEEGKAGWGRYIEDCTGGKHAEHHTGARLWYGMFVLYTRICPGNAYGTTAAARTWDHEGTNAADAGKNPAAGRSARETQHAGA